MFGSNDMGETASARMTSAIGPLTQTQEGRILLWLRSGCVLTPLEALQRFGCFRLGARIYDLRRAGYKIDRKMIRTAGGKTVAEYRMENGG